MSVPWLRFPPSLNMFFSYFPHPLLLILSRLPPPQLAWLCFCYALELHCPLPEDTFPSTLSILSSGTVPSPAQKRWTGHSVAMLVGVVSLWHLLSRSIPAAWNPARMWLYLPVCNDLCCFLKQWEEEPGKHFHSEVMEGAVWERDWPTNVWYVGLSKAGRCHPYSSRSLFHCLILEFWDWRMRIHYLIFSLFSDPLISYQRDAIQISLRECQTQIANVASKADAELLLISVVALFKAYHQRPRQGQGYDRHPVYFLNEWMNWRNRKDSPWKILVEWAD